jgi:XTP/dITP diphosphohydrolase
MKRLLVATTNDNKVREMAQVLAPLGFEVVGLHELGRSLAEPVEDADTFEGNARLKAVAYAQALALPCVAEDSGLEVDALGGAPGVYSARYAGVEGSRELRDRANNEKLLRELAHVAADERTARFVCALCFVDAQGTPLFETRGTYEGVITDRPRGQNGFGYDPLLLLPELGKTSAELTPAEKNARSHRGQATRALAAYLAREHG